MCLESGLPLEAILCEWNPIGEVAKYLEQTFGRTVGFLAISALGWLLTSSPQNSICWNWFRMTLTDVYEPKCFCQWDKTANILLKSSYQNLPDISCCYRRIRMSPTSPVSGGHLLVLQVLEPTLNSLQYTSFHSVRASHLPSDNLCIIPPLKSNTMKKTLLLSFTWEKQFSVYTGLKNTVKRGYSVLAE